MNGYQKKIWTSYGESYAESSIFLAESDKPDARKQATEAAIRAFDYFFKAKDYVQINTVLQDINLGSYDPYLWQTVIRKTKIILNQVPAGAEHCDMCLYLAGFLDDIGDFEQAIKIYRQAIQETKVLNDFYNLPIIYFNLANSLKNTGFLLKAKKYYLFGIQLKKKYKKEWLVSGKKYKEKWIFLDIISAELSILSIDIKCGKVTEPLIKVEKTLSELRYWWQCQQQGKIHPKLPPKNYDCVPELLLSALNIAENTNRVLKNWHICCHLFEEIKIVAIAYGESEYALRLRMFEYHVPLLQLGNLKKAQQELEYSLAVLKKFDMDKDKQARTLSALAQVWARQNDFSQAVALERQALTIYEQLTDLYAITQSHEILGLYLFQTKKQPLINMQSLL